MRFTLSAARVAFAALFSAAFATLTVFSAPPASASVLFTLQRISDEKPS